MAKSCNSFPSIHVLIPIQAGEQVPVSRILVVFWCETWGQWRQRLPHRPNGDINTGTRWAREGAEGYLGTAHPIVPQGAGRGEDQAKEETKICPSSLWSAMYPVWESVKEQSCCFDSFSLHKNTGPEVHREVTEYTQLWRGSKRSQWSQSSSSTYVEGNQPTRPSTSPFHQPLDILVKILMLSPWSRDSSRVSLELKLYRATAIPTTRGQNTLAALVMVLGMFPLDSSL